MMFPVVLKQVPDITYYILLHVPSEHVQEATV